MYLQKNTLISWLRMPGLLWTIKLMLRSATYWISGSELSRVTSGGAIFLQSLAILIGDEVHVLDDSFNASTTAELACCSRGVTRSMMDSDSRPSAGV